MSLEDAQAFWTQVKTDEPLRSRLEAAGDNEERLAIARDAGYNFTGEEFTEVRSRMADDELAGVTGGAASDDIYIDCTSDYII